MALNGAGNNLQCIEWCINLWTILQQFLKWIRIWTKLNFLAVLKQCIWTWETVLACTVITKAVGVTVGRATNGLLILHGLHMPQHIQHWGCSLECLSTCLVRLSYRLTRALGSALTDGRPARAGGRGWWSGTLPQGSTPRLTVICSTRLPHPALWLVCDGREEAVRRNWTQDGDVVKKKSKHYLQNETKLCFFKKQTELNQDAIYSTNPSQTNN